MKAKAVSQANTCSLPDRSAERDAVALGPEDALVMVLFPKASWDEVAALAGRMGVSTQETLGAALLLLRAKVEEEE